MTFRFGIDELLGSAELLQSLRSRQVALVAHPASVTCDLQHALDSLIPARRQGKPSIRSAARHARRQARQYD